MSDAAIIAIIAWVAVGGLFGAYIADQKGRHETEGWILGMAFGLIGVLIVALLPTIPKPPDDAPHP